MIINNYKANNKYLITILLLWLLMLPIVAIGCPICKYEQQSGGKCIDIGGYQLYMQTAGNTGPNIIFESGLGDSSTSWDKVVPQVMKFAHVIAYDRNGLGKSQVKPNETQPRTAQQVIENLHILLVKRNIEPPYILVGHSMGGLYMQLFAQEFPNKVLGVVLVDSATRDQSGNEPLPFKNASYYLEAQGIKASIEQVRQAPPFPAVPLVILTTTQRGKEWLSLQKGLLNLSPQSKQITTDKSGHYIQREEPELVINVLREMVNESQSKSVQQIMLPVKDFIVARNNHDVEAALKPFADNVVWLTSWNETLHGKHALRNMFEKQFQDNITNKIVSIPQINKNKATFQRRVAMNSWQKMGIDYLIEDTEVTVKNNKIIQFKSQYTKESAARLATSKSN